jgi:hypothetical protein
LRPRRFNTRGISRVGALHLLQTTRQTAANGRVFVARSYHNDDRRGVLNTPSDWPRLSIGGGVCNTPLRSRDPGNSTRNYYGGGLKIGGHVLVTCPPIFRMATPQEIYRKIFLPPRSLSGVFEFRRYGTVHEGARRISRRAPLRYLSDGAYLPDTGLPEDRQRRFRKGRKG